MKRALLLLALGSVAALAEDFQLNDSTVLPDAEVIRRGMDFVQVRYRDGMRKVKADLLPQELQERFEMRPEDIQARRDAIRREAEQREARRLEKEALVRQNLSDAGLHPRYMTGTDVLGMCSPLVSLDARVAEYVASLWNQREAKRLGLASEAERFADAVKSSQAFYDDARKEYLDRARSEKALRDQIAELEKKLDAAQDENKRLSRDNESLRQQLEKVQKNTGNTTVVVPPSRPSIVVPPYYYGPAIGPRPIVHPRTIVRPVVRPARASGLRPRGELPASNNPSNNPHTIRP